VPVETINGFSSAVTAGASRETALFVAAARATRELLNSSEIGMALPSALRLIGEAAGMDRLLVLVQAADRRGFPIHRVFCEWTAPGIATHLSVGLSEMQDADFPELVEALHSGQSYWTRLSDVNNRGREIFDKLAIRTTTGFPVFVAGKYAGLLAFDDCRIDRPYDPELAQAMGAAADVIAAAMQRELLVDAVGRERQLATQQRAAELVKANDALQATIDALSSATNPDRMVPLVLDIVARTFGASSCAVYRNEASGRIWLRYWHVDGKTLLPAELMQLDNEKFALVRQLAAGFEVPDTYLGAPPALVLGPVVLDHGAGTSIPEFDEFALSVGWGLELNIGVAARGIRASTLCIYRSCENRFSAHELALGESLAKQLGLAMETSRLAEEAREAAILRERTDALEERNAEARRIGNFLNATLGSLSESSDSQRTIELIVAGLAKELGAAHVFLFRHEADSSRLRLELSCIDGRIRRGPSGDEMPLFAGPFPDDVTPAWRIMTEARGLFTPDMSPSVDPSFGWPGAMEYAGRFKLSDVGHIVLFAGDRPVGSIGFGLADGRRLKPSDKPFIEAIARQTAIAIRMADLAEEARLATVSREREHAARQRAAELARANDAMQATIDALGALTDLDQFVPAALRVAAKAFGSEQAHFYVHPPGAPTQLRYWLRGGRVLNAAEILALRVDVPDSHPGVPAQNRLKAPVADHTEGSAVPESDRCCQIPGMETELNVPVVVGDTVAGSMLFFRGPGESFTAGEIALAEALAKQIALAVQASRVAEAAQAAALANEREAAAEQRVQELARANEALRRGVERISRDGSISSIVDAFLAESVRAVGAAAGSVILRVSDTSCKFQVNAVYDGRPLSQEEISDDPHLGAFIELSESDPGGLFSALALGGTPTLSVDDLRDILPAAYRYHVQRNHRTIWYAPLLLRDNVKGFIGLALEDCTVPTGSQRETIAALSQQLVLALELTRLAEGGRQAAIAGEREAAVRKQASLVAQVNQAVQQSVDRLNTASSTRAVIVETLRTMWEVLSPLGAIGTGLVMLAADGLTLRMTAYVQEGREVDLSGTVQDQDWAIDHPAMAIPARRVRNEDFVWGLTSDTTVLVPEARAFHESYGAKAVAYQPLRQRGETIGFVGISLKSEEPPSTPQMQLLSTLAGHLSLAIEMERLAGKAQNAALSREREKADQERAAKLTRTTEALKNTLDVVAFQPDLNKVLGHILRAITLQLDSSSSALWLRDRTTGRFSVRLICDHGTVMAAGGDQEISARIHDSWLRGRDLFFRDHITSRRPVVYQVPDLKALNPAAWRFFSSRGIHSLLGIPLLLGAEIVGSLTIRFMEPRTLTDDDLALTQAMAHQATMAIQLTTLAERAGEAALAEERIRLSREVHDTLAQGFTGILMQLGAASQVPDRDVSAIQPYLETIGTLARSSLAEARRSVRALRPLHSAQEPLSVVVERLIDRLRLQTEAEVSLRVEGSVHSMGPNAEAELARIVQEALHNVLKHACARHVSVALEFQGQDSLRISIKDDGHGFDPTRSPGSESFGLRGMHERAAGIGASLTVVSEKSRGTQIVVQYGPVKVK
jgi:signal transduction histidine kinase